MGHQVEYQVKAPGPVGDVADAIVEHLLGPQGTHEFELGPAVDPCDAGTRSLCHLDRQGAGSPARPVDEDPAAGRRITHALIGDRRRLGEGRRLEERESGRLGGERRGRHGRVLREPALRHEVVAVDLVADGEAIHVVSDGRHPAGDVGAQDGMPGAS